MSLTRSRNKWTHRVRQRSHTTVGVGTTTEEQEEIRGCPPDAALGPQGILNLKGRGRLVKKRLIKWSIEIVDIRLESEQRKEGRIQNSNDLTKGRRIKTMPMKLLGSKNTHIRSLILEKQAEMPYQSELSFCKVRVRTWICKRKKKALHYVK